MSSIVATSFARRDFIRCSALGGLALCGALPGQTNPKDSAKIRVAQIGVRHSHAAGKMAAMRSLPELCEVICVAEKNTERRAQAEEEKAYAGLRWLPEEEILADTSIRMIAVETDIPDLTATALRCLRAGKHIHLDKPGSADHAAFRQMRQEAEERGLLVQMGYMLRHNPAFELLFRAVREGWLGEVTGIDASMGKLADADGRREIGRYPGGGMFELACHLIDAVVTVLGPPQSAHGFSAPTQDDGVKDNQAAVLHYPRALAMVRCHHADPFGGPHRFFRVIGSKGTLEIAPLESGRITLSLAEARGEYRQGAQTFQMPVPAGRYDGEFRALFAAISENKTLLWNAAHDIAVHDTVSKVSVER